VGEVRQTRGAEDEREAEGGECQQQAEEEAVDGALRGFADDLAAFVGRRPDAVTDRDVEVRLDRHRARGGLLVGERRARRESRGVELDRDLLADQLVRCAGQRDRVPTLGVRGAARNLLAVDLDADGDVGNRLGRIRPGVDQGACHVEDVVTGLGLRRGVGAEQRDEDEQWK
jgi:hypothetical protein